MEPWGGGETCETFDLFLLSFTYYNLIKTVIFFILFLLPRKYKYWKYKYWVPIIQIIFPYYSRLFHHENLIDLVNFWLFSTSIHSQVH